MNTVSSSVAFKLNHPTQMHSFSSHHPGGGWFCFVDGSTHFISDDISCRTAGLDPNNTGDPALFLQAAQQGLLGTYQLLGAINDGMPIEAF